MPNILVVEDNQALNSFYCKVLETCGLTTTQATTYREAISYLEMSSPDAMLLDMNLPDGTGTDILDFMGTRGMLQFTQVVVVSGDAKHERRVTTQGTVNFLLKPVSTIALRDWALNIIDRPVQMPGTMPVTLDMREADHINYFTFNYPWEVKHLMDLYPLAMTHLNKVTHKVHTLANLTPAMNFIPVGAIRANNSPIFNHPNTGHIAIVGASGLARKLAVSALRIVRFDNLSFWDNEQDALDYLHRLVAEESNEVTNAHRLAAKAS